LALGLGIASPLDFGRALAAAGVDFTSAGPLWLEVWLAELLLLLLLLLLVLLLLLLLLLRRLWLDMATNKTKTQDLIRANGFRM